MSEIYWLTRLDAIHGLSIALLVAGAMIGGVSLIGYIVNRCSEIESDYHKEEHKLYKELCGKLSKYFFTISIVGLLGTVFVPTTNQGLAIYGIGGTIDYIKQNPTAKKIPDKCINALDRWVNSWNIEKVDSVKKEYK